MVEALKPMQWENIFNRSVGLGVLNAIIPGLGYIAIKRRWILGFFLLVGFTLSIAWGWIEPLHPLVSGESYFFYSQTSTGFVVELIMWATAMIGFGYDAYASAERERKGQN